MKRPPSGGGELWNVSRLMRTNGLYMHPFCERCPDDRAGHTDEPTYDDVQPAVEAGGSGRVVGGSVVKRNDGAFQKTGTGHVASLLCIK